MSMLTGAEQLLAQMTRAEKAQLLQWLRAISAAVTLELTASRRTRRTHES